MGPPWSLNYITPSSYEYIYINMFSIHIFMYIYIYVYVYNIYTHIYNILLIIFLLYETKLVTCIALHRCENPKVTMLAFSMQISIQNFSDLMQHTDCADISYRSPTFGHPLPTLSMFVGQCAQCIYILTSKHKQYSNSTMFGTCNTRYANYTQ